MKLSIHHLVIPALLLMMSACKQPKPSAYDLDHPEKYDPNPFVTPLHLTPAETIASAGHGAVFDHTGKPLTLNNEQVLSMQASMIEQMQKSAWTTLPNKTQDIVEEALTLTSSNDLKAAEKTILNAAVIETLKKNTDDKLQAKLIWRHNILLHKIRINFRRWEPTLNQRIIDLIRRMGLRGLFNTLATPSTDYVARCRAEGVPTPPSWSLATPAAWRYQGILDNELILAADETHAWTWADPHKRGGCILLPRGGGAAGLICQSATTGKACFWDNIDRTNGVRINWRTATMDINNMQDGDSLTENCTNCHRGNNVFLISPDNATWKKIIKQSQSVANAGVNFTTRIENAAIARYIPVSNQPTWSNPSSTQCVGCHEKPGLGFPTIPSPMPPACSTAFGDPTNCYN